MLERDCLAYFSDWFHRASGRKPLLIRGARQTGKTTAVRMFAERQNLHLIEINMEKPWIFTSILHTLNPRKIIEALELELGINIDPDRSLIFFDEVQAQPEVLAVLRYFYEETPQYGVIATGSLLEFVLAEPEFSIPVGRLELFHFGPMSFEEFLRAMGQKKALDQLSSYMIGEAISEVVHKNLNRWIRSYTIVGGMPEAVDCLANGHNLKEVEKIKSGIVETLRLDFNKYRPKANSQLLTIIFDSLPRMIGQKLIYSRITKGYRSKDVSTAIHQLCLARIAIKVFNCSANGVPLAAEKNDRFFKMLSLDTGLLLTQLKLVPTEIETTPELNLVNNGALAEQLVGQLLYSLSPTYQEPELYYWAREAKASSSEVDYLYTDQNNNIIPLEVKAGSTGSLRSLHIMVKEKGLKVAVRFNSDRPTILNERRGTAKGKVDFTLLSLPHYLVQQLPRLIEQLSV